MSSAAAEVSATAAKPIRSTLMKLILLTSGTVLLFTTLAFFAYELLTFRQATIQQVRTLGQAIAANSTAALAFDSPDDARAVLAAFRADPHIVAAALYDRSGNLFAWYPEGLEASALPRSAPAAVASTSGGAVGTPRIDYVFEAAHLVGLEPVTEGARTLGTLFVKSDLKAINERIRLYGAIALLVIAASGLLAWFMSGRLQAQISGPYNRMIGELQSSDTRLRSQLSRMDLLQHITRAIGDRQDLPSIFQVVLRNLERSLSVDFACACLGASPDSLVVTTVGARSRQCSAELDLAEGSVVPVDANGLGRCLRGKLVYEPDVREILFPFPRRLAGGGLRSLVLAPLIVENRVFGVLVAARREAQAFSSPDCEFLKQLTEHVALASHQTQLHGALQQAYDDLRQTQHTVMQQERLRALGQMASGIAHDINNAISPVSLYTDSLLEREPNLSERARGYLTTIQRAIEDVAGTVARMREFYRPREPQLTLAKIDVNRTIEEVIEMTHARWYDLPQQRGVDIELRQELSAGGAQIMGADGEIRDALTNLIFNAVDAMPDGGTLTLRTRVVTSPEGSTDPHAMRLVQVEVVDSGVGMDEETRRRCLEPFFTTKGERGTGLGLAMVYGMVQRHSAELQIDSRAGAGTTMRLLFPAFTEALTNTLGLGTTPFVAQRLRILLVDDDPLLIKSVQDTLEADGHLVTATNGGQAGIDAFKAALLSGNAFAVVVTDLGMPQVDGRKVAAAVKAASPGTPVIMLTGWGHRLMAENDVPPNVDRILNKPPRLHELRGALAELTTPAGRPS